MHLWTSFGGTSWSEWRAGGAGPSRAPECELSDGRDTLWPRQPGQWDGSKRSQLALALLPPNLPPEAIVLAGGGVNFPAAF